MPRYKKRYKKKRSYWKYGKSALSIARTALATAKFVKSVVNTEFKVSDVNTGGAISNTGTIASLTKLLQGDDENMRQGNSVRWKSLIVRGTISIDASATDSVFRMLVVHDRSPQGLQPTFAQVLEDTDVNGLMNLNYRKRFKILCDKSYSLSINGARVRAFKLYKKLNIKSIYSASAETDAVCMTDHIYMYLLSDEPTNTPTLNIKVRLRFIDN